MFWDSTFFSTYLELKTSKSLAYFYDWGIMTVVLPFRTLWPLYSLFRSCITFNFAEKFSLNFNLSCLSNLFPPSKYGTNFAAIISKLFLTLVNEEHFITRVFIQMTKPYKLMGVLFPRSFSRAPQSSWFVALSRTHQALHFAILLQVILAILVSIQLSFVLRFFSSHYPTCHYSSAWELLG